MRKACVAEVAKQRSDYDTHRDAFVGEVLRSAALHTERDAVGMRNKRKPEERRGNRQLSDGQGQREAGHRFLPYQHWHNFPKLCSGRFCKEEFLAYACSTGTGLPFASPHSRAATYNGKDVSYSYSRFRSKLDRARESLPADEGEKVSGFGVEELEWLAVCLCVPDWEAGVRTDLAGKAGESSTEGAVPVSKNGAEASSKAITERKGRSSTDIAIQNLADQLGVDDGPKSFLARFSNPFLRGAEGCILWGNRNVLELSVHVDNWLAICAGEHMAYMASKVPGMSIGALVRKSESDGVRKECARLEKLLRFMFQMSVVEPEHSYFDESVTFMGVSMENLRSMLAKWVETHVQTEYDTWNPKIQIERAVEFTASSDFESLMNGLARSSCLSKRFVKMRILWELKDKLQSILNENRSCPSHTAALVLCLLSFPAVCFKVNRSESDSGTRATSAGRNRFCCIKIEEEEEAEFDIVEYTIAIRAALSPQDLHVDVSFSRVTDGSGIAITVRLRSEESDAEARFEWESWRDAFRGSREGVRMWKEQHGFRALPVLRSSRGIENRTFDVDTSNSGTGNNMKIWAGWLPCNAAICKYEIMSDDFILERKTAGFTTNYYSLGRNEQIGFVECFRWKLEAVQYEDATVSALQHASMVSHDFLQRASESTSFPTQGWHAHSEDICSKADNILKEGKVSGTKTALLYYTIAASEMGDASALGKAIDILLAKKSVNAAERAVELLERFYLIACGRSVSLRNRFQDKEWVGFLKSKYKLVLAQASCSTVVVLSYSGFCHLLSCCTDENAIEDATRVLSNALVHVAYSKSILLSLLLRRNFAFCLEAEKNDMFYLACTVYSNLMEFIDSYQKQEPFKIIDNRNALRQYWFRSRPGNAIAKGILPPPSAESDAVRLEKSNALSSLGALLEAGTESVAADLPRAVDLYISAIEGSAHVASMHNLARLLVIGAQGVPTDAPRAVDLFSRAIEEGACIRSMHNLAVLLENGAEGVPAEAPRAVDLYTRAIEQGDFIGSMNGLAHLLMNGAEGVPIDAPRAAELFTRAIEEGANVESMCSLGVLLQNGAEGVPKDASRAVDLYSRAIEDSAHVASMNNLAALLVNGAEGVPADAPRAVDLYTRAIEEGAYIGSMNNLACLLQFGAEGVRADAPRAVDLYTRSIEEGGCIESMNNLALILENGAEGVKQDAPRAVDLYTRAIEEGGLVLSMNNLAFLLVIGAEGVPSNAPKAVDLFTRAMEEGANAEALCSDKSQAVRAMYSLATLLEEGADGVPRDRQRALALYGRLVSSGSHEGAAGRLAAMEKSGHSSE